MRGLNANVLNIEIIILQIKFPKHSNQAYLKCFSLYFYLDRLFLYKVKFFLSNFDFFCLENNIDMVLNLLVSLLSFNLFRQVKIIDLNASIVSSSC